MGANNSEAVASVAVVVGGGTLGFSLAEKRRIIRLFKLVLALTLVAITDAVGRRLFKRRNALP